jgi:hypothetical protein
VTQGDIDATTLQLFRRPGSHRNLKSWQQAAAEMLDWPDAQRPQRHGRHGDEPPRQGVHLHLRSRQRRRCASCWPCRPTFKILFMQGGGLGENAIVPMNLAGRQHIDPALAVRLRGHRQLEPEVAAGSRKYSHVQSCRQQCARRPHPDTGPGQLAASRRRRSLRAHLQQRDHPRGRVPGPCQIWRHWAAMRPWWWTSRHMSPPARSTGRASGWHLPAPRKTSGPPA